jgi:putative NADPH-quinone reductase
MRVLLLFCHPVETSFHAALHSAAKAGLERAGHTVDDLDLYAEGFDPVLSRAERLGYLDVPRNRAAVQPYVDRLLAAEALVLCFPVWNFGPPAMLKGFFDRVLLPGVAFTLGDDGSLTPTLRHIRVLAGITSYGRPRWAAWLMGDPPRKVIKRHLRYLVHPRAKTRYLAHYAIEVATARSRQRFLAKVERTMAGL